MYYYSMVFKLKDTVHDVQDDHPLTNTLGMPNNFYITSNKIQTPFNYHFDTYSNKCMMYNTMVFKLNDTVPDVQDDHPLQNRSSEWYYKHICNAK